MQDNADSQEARVPSALVHSCMFVAIVLFAFDFKANPGASNTWQSALLGLNIGLMAVLMVLLKFWDVKLSAVSWIGLLWMIGQVVNYIYRDRIALIDILRWGFPFFALFIYAHIVQSALVRGMKREWIISSVLISAFISTYFSIASAILFKGLNMAEMRYQILSPILPIAIAFSIGMLVFKGKSLLLPIMMLSGTAFSLLTAITRTTVFMVLISFLLYFLYGILEARNYSVSLRKIATLGFVVLGSLSVALSVRPTLWDDWIGRFYWGGSKVSTDDDAVLGRMMEYQGQLQYWGESSLNKLIGLGVGHPYPSYAGEAVFTGHGMWVYSLFTSGILLCWALPAVFIYLLVQGYRNSVHCGKDSFYQYYAFICVAAAAILVYSMTAHPLGTRLAGVIYGVLIGLVVYRNDC